MKFLISLILVTLIIILSVVPAEANSEVGSINVICEDIPTEFRTALGEVSLTDIDGVLSFENVLSLILKGVTAAFSKNRAQYVSLFSITVAYFLYATVGRTLGKNGTDIGNLAFTVVCSASVYLLLVEICTSFTEKFNAFSGFVSSASAVGITATVSNASGASAAIIGTFFSVLAVIYDHVCVELVLPFAMVYITLVFCGTVFADSNVRRFSAFIRNVFVTVICSFLTLFSGIMSVQSVVSLSKDTVFKRLLKQAISTGLPVLGGAVSDGVDTLFASALELKNSVGLLGISVTVGYSLYSVSELLLCFFVITFLCFMLSFFETGAVNDILISTRDVISVLICIAFSVTVLTSLMFYFIIKTV